MEHSGGRTIDSALERAGAVEDRPVAVSSGGAVLRESDGRARRTGSCGDSVEIFVRLDGGVVGEVGYHIDGCVYTLACVRAAEVLARGCSLPEALRAITAERIEELLGGLPPENKHCAELASGAFCEALRDAIATTREPWRRMYQKRF